MHLFSQKQQGSDTKGRCYPFIQQKPIMHEPVHIIECCGAPGDSVPPADPLRGTEFSHQESVAL